MNRNVCGDLHSFVKLLKPQCFAPARRQLHLAQAPFHLRVIGLIRLEPSFEWEPHRACTTSYLRSGSLEVKGGDAWRSWS